MKNYLKTVFTEFLHSFKHWRTILAVLLYDIIFSFIAFGLFYLTASLLNELGQSVEGFASMPAAESTLSLLQSFIAKSAALVIAFFLVLTSLYAFFRARMWQAILGFKANRKIYFWFWLTTLLWSAIWFVGLYAVMKGLQPSFAALGIAALPLLYVHFTTLLHHYFFTKKHSWESAVSALSTGIGRFYWFIVPYILAVIVFFLWSQVWRVLPRPGDMFFASLMLVVVILAPFFAWFRVFMAGLMKRVE